MSEYMKRAEEELLGLWRCTCAEAQTAVPETELEESESAALGTVGRSTAGEAADSGTGVSALLAKARRRRQQQRLKLKGTRVLEKARELARADMAEHQQQQQQQGRGGEEGSGVFTLGGIKGVRTQTNGTTARRWRRPPPAPRPRPPAARDGPLRPVLHDTVRRRVRRRGE